MTRSLTLTFLLSLATGTAAWSQTPVAPAAVAQTQTLRGRVVDVATQQPLPGASVRVVGTALGVLTDETGSFRLAGVPVGRQTIAIAYVGYETQTIPNVLITTGKEAVLPIEMQEQAVVSEAVVISANERPDLPLNEFAATSIRAFNAEETGRYAGSRNDVARMATNYAGVSGANDARNDIIVRGNSPLGLLWRLEGVDIPNPNHFSGIGNTGGPVGMLNNNLLEKSDFLTGAFPAQYGNALSGVFDLRMRAGNSEKREFLGQVGFNGFELGAEGPINREKQSSYLVNYRYSTIAVFQSLGLQVGTGTAVPYYQDGAFKLNFPLTKLGSFSVWGMGGVSSIDLLDSKNDPNDPDAENLYGNGGFDNRVKNGTAVGGLTHRYFFSSRTTGTLSLTYSATWNRFSQDSLDTDRKLHPYGDGRQVSSRLGIYYRLLHKVNARNTLQFGLSADRLGLDYQDSLYRRNLGRFQQLRDVNSGDWLNRAFVQWQHRFGEKVTLTTGLSALHFSLTQDFALEPRAGIRWQATQRLGLTGAYGLHHQIQPLWAYYFESETPAGRERTNAALDFTRSHHWVLGADYQLAQNTRLKLEAYYQQLDQVPVRGVSSSFSMLNVGAGFGPENEANLVNNGTGYNYGVELTLERTFSKGLYYLVNGSWYNSRYKGSDSIERSTAFDNTFIANVLAGKEWKLTGRSVLTLDTKVTASGGRRFTPVDFAASAAAGYQILREDLAYSERLPDYFRWDVKIGWRFNGRRVTHEFSVDLQNVTGRQNAFVQQYDRLRNQLVTTNQIGFLPIPQYRITF